MCGIVGFSGKNANSTFNKDKIKLLFFWNYKDRGKDSTGLWSPKNDVIKNTKSADKFWIEADENIKEDNLLIGHVRASTSGLVNNNNAHPFKENWAVLCHNGTLTNHNTVATSYGLKFGDYSIDSQVIAKCLDMDKNSEIFEKIEGSFACLFSDHTNTTKSAKKLYVVRNEERPLYYGFLDEGMYISSIEDSLKLIGCTDTKQFSVGIVYTISNGKITSEKEIKLKAKSTTTQLFSSNDFVGHWICKDNTGAKNFFINNVNVFHAKKLEDINEGREIKLNEWVFCSGLIRKAMGAKEAITDCVIINFPDEPSVNYIVPKTWFHYDSKFINPVINGRVIAMVDLKIKDGSNISKGTTLVVDDFNKEKVIISHPFDNDVTVNVPYKLCRPAVHYTGGIDENLYSDIISKTLIVKNLPVQYNLYGAVNDDDFDRSDDTLDDDIRYINSLRHGSAFNHNEREDVLTIPTKQINMSSKKYLQYDNELESHMGNFHRFLRMECFKNYTEAVEINKLFDLFPVLKSVKDVINNITIDVEDYQYNTANDTKFNLKDFYNLKIRIFTALQDLTDELITDYSPVDGK
jgi:predicted glutamine amidotransferase